jgi:hypothetical protein
MTTESEGTDLPSEPDEERPIDDGDFELGMLVRLANAGAMSLGVTLWVGGSVISGLLVGAATYFDGVAEKTARAGGDGGEVLAGLYRDKAAAFREQIGTEFETAFSAPYTLTFIHLQHARVFSPGGFFIPRDEGVWWRGRIDRVDGFFIGNFSTE